MEYQEYMTQRFDVQRKYYSEKSGKYQKNYRTMRICQIILAASLPFLVANITDQTYWWKIASGAAGVLIAVLEGVQSLYKYQDKAIEYRKASESMKHEHWLFEAKSGAYTHTETALKTFVERVEGIISEENKSWVTFSQKESAIKTS
jgi:Protein of unknown function (DUF4231)